jgi:methyl-accepting chemotaxis protein
MEFARANGDVRFVYLESEGEKMASFPQDLVLDDAVLTADTLVVRDAPIESEALAGKVYVGASTGRMAATARRSFLTAVGVALGLVALGAVAALWLAGLIVRPIREAVDQIHALADGRLQELPETDRRDEVGQMSRALNRTIVGIRGALEADQVDWDDITEQRRREARLQAAEAERVEREREEAVANQRKVDAILGVVEHASRGDLTGSVDLAGDGAVDQVARGLNRLLEELRTSIAHVSSSAATLSGASGELSGVTDRIGRESSETRNRAREATDAAALVSDSVRSVSAATEEMTVSVREIARSAAHAAQVARNAVAVADRTNAGMEALGDSSVQIGSVVQVIASIAGKTNLLALNATIEAARAGDAGKGFAVVATEVKELAAQSAKAAQEIADKVTAIQSDSAGAVDALKDISRIIMEIDEIQSTIAAAVEEQTATTQEIGRNLTDAAGASQQITSTIESVAVSAQSTSEGVAQAVESVSKLERMAVDLDALVGRFRYVSDGEAAAAPLARAG